MRQLPALLAIFSILTLLAGNSTVPAARGQTKTAPDCLLRSYLPVFMGRESGGGVNVLFGSATGLTHLGNQFLSQNDIVQRQPDEDIYTDLGDLIATAEPGDEFGSASGLTLTGEQYIEQDSLRTAGALTGDLLGSAPEDGDLLGFSLAAGDFNGDGFGFALSSADYNDDGYDELVVGVPSAISMSNAQPAGGINLLLGSSGGLIRSGNRAWEQGGGWNDKGEYLGDLYGGPEEYDAFGFALP